MAAPPRRLTPSPATSNLSATGLDLSARSLLASSSEGDILAWLRLLRSIESCLRSRPGDDHLSQNQLNALRWLSSLPNSKAEQWLAARRAQILEVQDRKNLSSINTAPRSTSSRASTGPTRRTTLPSSERLSPEHETAPESDQSQSVSPDGAVRHPSSSTSSLYWSTAEDSPQQFTTFDGFRRHENERERYYILLPNGLSESSAQGPVCALCLASDPDVKHFEMHNALRFMEDSRNLTKRTRKENFKKLLRTCNISDEHVDRLVRKWHFTYRKQGYSCGLCIKLFSTLLERTNHLARDHYELGENRDGWDITTIIRGLLLQPDINKAFRKQYSMDPSQLTWTSTSVHSLRDRLESRKESPQVLAQATFDAADRSDVTSAYEDTLVPRNHVFSVNDGVISSNQTTSRGTGSQSPDAKFSNPIHNFDSQWINLENNSMPLNAWTSFSTEMASSGSFDPMAHVHLQQGKIPTRHENYFEEQAVQQPLGRSTSQGEEAGNQVHNMYASENFSKSNLVGEDAPSSNSFWEQGSWYNENFPLSMIGYEGNAGTPVNEPQRGHSTLKRKHSLNTSGAPSSKSFITSPDDIYSPSEHHSTNYK